MYTCEQDLHIHTIYSTRDSAVAPEQTPELVASVKHARITGISDHFEYLVETDTQKYIEKIHRLGMHCGCEVDGHSWVKEASGHDFEYYLYHCRDTAKDYKGIETLLATNKPVIIAHPYATETNLNKVPVDCLVEINNRYIWKYNWRSFFKNHLNRFRFVLGSDAHQPNWLNQNVARYVANELGIEETILF